MPNSRLLKNYDKICPICNKEFYSRNLIVKYCSKSCAIIALKKQQKINLIRHRKNKKK